MTTTRILLTLGMLAACQTESMDESTNSTEQEIGGYFCNAKFPALSVWNGKAPPAFAGSRIVVIATPYTGWRLLSVVDTNKATIPYSVYVHDSQVQQMAAYTIDASIAGPGGNPPPPPCEQGPSVRCGQWMVAFAQRVELAVGQAFQDCQTCSSPNYTTGF